jgi:hypothetical protein
MTTKNSQFVLYKSFVDAFMKGHPGMTKYVNIIFNDIPFLFLNKLFHFPRLVITILKSNGIK